jgi:1-phosphofructokinase family hexose kinase
LILTLTINPAIDRNVTADRLVFEDRGYITSTDESAGGRGINASHVIHTFGGKTIAIATAGGKSGGRFKRLLECCKFPVEIIPIKNEIRANLTITDAQGLTIKLNEMGPHLGKEEVARVEKKVLALLSKADWLMLCGSLPPGTPSNLYARLIDAARQKGVRTLIDADREALRESVEASPTLITPNQQEAERLLETVILTRTHSLEAVRKLRSMGPEFAVLSLGSRGAMGAAPDVIFEATPPHVDALCPIGAGDALAAALVWAMESGRDFADALRWGVAAGTASTKLPGVRFASLEQTKEIYQKVDVRQVA